MDLVKSSGFASPRGGTEHECDMFGRATIRTARSLVRRILRCPDNNLGLPRKRDARIAISRRSGCVSRYYPCRSRRWQP